MKYNVIVIGASFGGLNALKTILPILPKDFSIPIVIVQHLGQESNKYMLKHLDSICDVGVKEAEEKEKMKPGIIYFAPSNYHLLIEDDMTLSLSVEEKVNYSRPSIDVLFESAAYAFHQGVVGLVLTGANTDGSLGLKKIKEFNGLTIVQSPDTAEATAMPQGAIDTCSVDHIIPLANIGHFLVELLKVG